MTERTPPVGPPIFDLESPLPMLGPQTHWVHSSSPQAIQRHLGRNLRQVYAALPSEPVPEAMAALLRRLDTTQSQRFSDPDATED